MEVTESETGHPSPPWPCSIYTHRKWHSDLHLAWWKCSQLGHTAFRQEPRVLFVLVHATLNTDTTLALPDPSLRWTHTGAPSHTQRASYKNIQVSPNLPDGCYRGNTVTNRARVQACLRRWAETLQRSVAIKQRKWTWAWWSPSLLSSCLQHATNFVRGNKYFIPLVWAKDKHRPCVNRCTITVLKIWVGGSIQVSVGLRQPETVSRQYFFHLSQYIFSDWHHSVHVKP